MSARVMGMVFEAGPAEATQRFVLLAIADNSNDSGFAFPGVDLLAAKSCQTVRNVLRILQALEVGGWLTIKRRSWGDKKRFSSYQINLSRLKKAVGKGSVAPGDNMSCGEAKEADSIGLKQARSDNMSCVKPPVEMASRGDIRGVHEVTNSSSRGDISDIPFNVFNRQEPSTETTNTPQPPKGGSALDARPLRADGVWGNGEEQKPAHEAKDEKAACSTCADAAVARVLRECGFSNARIGRVVRDAMTTELQRADSPPGGWKAEDFGIVADRMIAARRTFIENASLMFRKPRPQEFFGEGMWLDQALWPWDRRELQELRDRTRARIGL